MKQPERRRVPVEILKGHKRQMQFFENLSEEMFQLLMHDMQQHGQRVPIEILPDGTIICGHQRTRAALELGWTEIEAIIRHDLADDPTGTERLLITDNLARRQLRPLEMARSLDALKKLSARDGRRILPPGVTLRDWLGAQIGKSGREVDRLLRVLRAPIEIQRAVDAGLLGIVKAGRVVGLAKAQQEALAAELRRDGFDEAIVDRYLEILPPRATAPAPEQAAVAALREAVEWLEVLDPQALPGDAATASLLQRAETALQALCSVQRSDSRLDVGAG